MESQVDPTVPQSFAHQARRSLITDGSNPDLPWLDCPLPEPFGSLTEPLGLNDVLQPLGCGERERSLISLELSAGMELRPCGAAATSSRPHLLRSKLVQLGFWPLTSATAAAWSTENSTAAAIVATVTESFMRWPFPSKGFFDQ